MALADAVAAHVRPGDDLHVVCGHTRWTAAATEVVRQWWGRDPGFTLTMLSLSSLGTLFVRGGLVRRIVTGYSGDVFPTFSPNRIFGDAYLSGEVEVEHWSFLTFAQRLEAGARGLRAVTTASLTGSSMAENPGYEEVEDPFGGEGEAPLGLLAAHRCDVALVHGAVADREGNVAFHPPMLEGVWGALGARRGAIVTVERIVDDIRPWAHLVRLPGHQVLSVSACPLGAHPGGLYGRFTPAEPYGEDQAFWASVRDASRRDDFDDWIAEWILDVPDHAAYVAKLGSERVTWLRERADPESWRADEAAHPPDLAADANGWEIATVLGARVLADAIADRGADAVLAGAGVANLAAWLGVALARDRGSRCVLTAELGLWGYEPTPADPYVFNHRSFPTSTMLADSSEVLGMVVPGPGTTTLACLGAAIVDAEGNIDSTVVPGKAFLVGSGGGNDVATTCDQAVVVTTLTPRRTVAAAPYVTSPGVRVSHLVTDLATFERGEDGRFVLTSVPAGEGSVAERIERVRARCGWDLVVADQVAETAPPTADELARLRRWDPQGTFLRA